MLLLFDECIYLFCFMVHTPYGYNFFVPYKLAQLTYIKCIILFNSLQQQQRKYLKIKLSNTTISMKYLGINLTTTTTITKSYMLKTIKFYRKAKRILNNWEFSHATE